MFTATVEFIVLHYPHGFGYMSSAMCTGQHILAWLIDLLRTIIFVSHQLFFNNPDQKPYDQE